MRAFYLRGRIGRAVLCAALTSPLSFSFSSVASAQPAAKVADPAAQSHWSKGNIHYNLQSYPEAIVEYKLGYAIEPWSGFLWAIAQSQRLHHECPAAIRSYQAFVRSGATPAQAAAAATHVKECETEVGAAPVAAPPSAPPPAPAKEPAVAPVPAPSIKTAAAAPVERPKRSGVDPLAITLGVGGALVAGAGVVLLVRGNADVMSGNAASRYDDYANDKASGQRFQRFGVVGIAAGAALIGGGALRFVLHRPAAAAAAARRGAVEVAAATRVGGAAIELRGTF